MPRRRSALCRRLQPRRRTRRHGQDLPEADRIDVPFEQVLDGRFIIGSPEECVKQIARYRELGFSHVALRLFYPEMPQQDVLEHIELVGKEVLPAVHQL